MGKTRTTMQLLMSIRPNTIRCDAITMKSKKQNRRNYWDDETFVQIIKMNVGVLGREL